jgi:hypothetical protein
MRLKQKAMTAAKDYHLTTDDFMEARKNFIHGMRRHLIVTDLEGEVSSGEVRASECADMFAEFFSIIAARPDYMLALIQRIHHRVVYVVGRPSR